MVRNYMKKEGSQTINEARELKCNNLLVITQD